MTNLRSWTRPVAALGLALSGVLLGGAAPAALAAGGAAAVSARSAPACTVPALNVHKGRLEGAAGSRFLTVRVTNEGAHACATPGWTRYRFYNRDGGLGFRSRRNPGYDPGAAPVVIGAGDTAKSVLSWTDPGVVSRHSCHPRRAVGARLAIAGLPGRFRLHHLDTRVCTTKKYRPHGTRLSN
ncbi:MAG: hypothetical protein QOK15_773 [Nocardioidaceae bacterium]|jgi:hypothetical protein|nr:hypothetical protein [Nocardioidaceae bacterium]